MRNRSFRIIFITIFVLCVFSLIFARDQKVKEREFSFVHLSDSHVSPFFSMPDNLANLRSYKCIRTLPDLGQVKMPYKITAPKYSFLIHSGDVAEYSFPGVTWELVEKYFEGISEKIYYIAGNHDNTWVLNTSIFNKYYGGMNYSFDYQGCHFIGLCTASYQEPVPSIGREVVLFLEKDIENVDSQTPVFVFLHHPLNPKSFSCRYEIDRILDPLREKNIVLIMDGHGHSAVKHDYWGLDGIEGGSTFSKRGDNDGYNIVYVKANKLYAAYKKMNEEEAKKPLLEKSISLDSPPPLLRIDSPAEGSVLKDSVTLSVALSGISPEKIRKMTYFIDDGDGVEIQPDESGAKPVISVKNLKNGSHAFRLEMDLSDGGKIMQSTDFVVEDKSREKQSHASWRFRMDGASKTTPLIHDETVYAGANDGYLYALNEKDGKLQWKFDAKAEILSSPVYYKGSILFGSGNGKFYALDTNGRVKWKYEAGSAVYSTPVVDENGICYFGTNEAKLIALEAETGKEVWVNSDARYSVESRPAVTKDRVYFGAWDGYFYCADKKTGKTLWKKAGPKNLARKTPSRYYGPADNGPVASGDEVFIADRGYLAGKYKSDGTYLGRMAEGCSALALSPDGKSLYLRCTSSPVKKMDANGSVLWNSEVTAGRMPVSPTVTGDAVYVCTNTGRLCSLDPETGKIKWEYQVTPGMYVMSEVAVGNDCIFVTDTDGWLTAVTLKN